MPLCPYCHTVVSEDPELCPRCGRPLAAEEAARGTNKKKLTGIIVACIIAIIAAVVLVRGRPWEGTLSTETYVLTTVVTPSGAGSVSPASGEYESGAQVTLTATSATGYLFDHWSGGTSDTTSTTTITMDSGKSLTAHFKTVSMVPEVLFSDDFSDDGSGWLAYDEYDGRVVYLNGCFNVKDYTVPDWTIYGESQHYFTDFVLEVGTWLVDGTDDNYHVVFCRWQDEDNCYAFGISADGYYAVNKFVDSDMTTFVGPAYSTYIHQGQGVTNLIHIECIGNNLNLSVNGHLLWEGRDATFADGDIALGADAIGGTFTEVAFDNITITKP